MDTDEREIFQFLKTWGSVFVSAVEIARRSGTRKRFHQEPHWAKPVLQSMAERGILERDIQGRYRIKPVRRKNHGPASPDLTNPSGESGAPTPAEAGDEGEMAEDEYYEQL